MNFSNIVASMPRPTYQYMSQTGLVKYVFVDFTDDPRKAECVATDYPYIMEFIQRQFQRICVDFGIKYQNFDDIRKIASDYISFCREVGYVEDEPNKHTEKEILDITSKTAGYDEKMENWLQKFLTFLSDRNTNQTFIINEEYHNDLMFNVAFCIMAVRETALYLCGNYVLIETIKQLLELIYKSMFNELSVEEISELNAMRKETSELMKIIQYKVDNIEDMNTFVPSDKNRFFMKYPNNVFSNHINELKKNNQYNPEKYATTYFIGNSIADNEEDGIEYKPIFNMFSMPLVSKINNTDDSSIKKIILDDYAWSKWLVRFEDEFAKYPDELAKYVDVVKPGDYIHINPIFRYK
jgi:hypothetical protein